MWRQLEEGERGPQVLRPFARSLFADSTRPLTGFPLPLHSVGFFMSRWKRQGIFDFPMVLICRALIGELIVSTLDSLKVKVETHGEYSRGGT